MAQSYIVNGKFVLPQLPPSCFGVATRYSLTSEDIQRMIETNACELVTQDASGKTVVMIAGELYSEGDKIDGGIYTVSNKARKQRAKIGKRRNSKQYDTCVIVPRNDKDFKPGSSRRIEALQQYYETFPQDMLLSSDDAPSPFHADLADLVSKSAIGKVWEEFDKKEVEIASQDVA